MTRSLQIAVMAAAAIVLSGGGFVAGMTVGGGGAKPEAVASTSASPAGGRRVVIGGAGANAGFGQVSGRVLSVGDGSITIEARQPGGGDAPRSVIALVGAGARVVRSTETEIKASDIKAGDQVIVVGQPDPQTGVMSANAVVVGINALQQLFGGGGGPGGAPPSGGGAPRRVTPSPTPAR